MFRKYHSIENTFQKEFLDKIKNHGFEKRAYIVQEKAHGSNISFWTNNGVDFKAGKRTGILEQEEKFYDYWVVMDKIISKLKTLWDELVNTQPDLKQLTVFGELIGGDYPHPDVPSNKTAVKV